MIDFDLLLMDEMNLPHMMSNMAINMFNSEQLSQGYKFFMFQRVFQLCI